MTKSSVLAEKVAFIYEQELPGSVKLFVINNYMGDCIWWEEACKTSEPCWIGVKLELVYCRTPCMLNLPNPPFFKFVAAEWIKAEEDGLETLPWGAETVRHWFCCIWLVWTLFPAKSSSPELGASSELPFLKLECSKFLWGDRLRPGEEPPTLGLARIYSKLIEVGMPGRYFATVFAVSSQALIAGTDCYSLSPAT